MGLILERLSGKGLIVESDRKKLPEGVLCRVVYPICNIGEMNRNKRIYGPEVWERVGQDPDLQEKLKGRCLFGHAEHPKDTSQSSTEKISHVVTKIFNEDKKLVKCEIDVLDTPYGRICDSLLRAGCGIGTSTRAEGELEEVIEEGKESYYRVIPETYSLKTVDFTADPSTYGAYPESVERDLVGIVKAGVDSEKIDRQYASVVLESLKVSEAKDLLEAMTHDLHHKECKCKPSEKKCGKGCSHAVKEEAAPSDNKISNIQAVLKELFVGKEQTVERVLDGWNITVKGVPANEEGYKAAKAKIDPYIKNVSDKVTVGGADGNLMVTVREVKQVIVKAIPEERKAWICPHCNEEIREKSLAYDEAKDQWFHRGPCFEKGPIQLPESKDTTVYESLKTHCKIKESKLGYEVVLTAAQDAAPDAVKQAIETVKEYVGQLGIKVVATSTNSVTLDKAGVQGDNIEQIRSEIKKIVASHKVVMAELKEAVIKEMEAGTAGGPSGVPVGDANPAAGSDKEKAKKDDKDTDKGKTTVVGSKNGEMLDSVKDMPISWGDYSKEDLLEFAAIAEKNPVRFARMFGTKKAPLVGEHLTIAIRRLKELTETKGGGTVGKEPIKETIDFEAAYKEMQKVSDEYLLGDLDKKFISEAKTVLDLQRKTMKITADARKNEAIAKAERDKAVEMLEARGIELAKMDKSWQDKIKELGEGVLKETKAIYEKKMDEMKKAHDAEITKIKEEAKREIFVKTVIEARVKASGLELPEDAMAVVRACKTEEEVDAIISKFRFALKENMLHGGKPGSGKLNIGDGEVNPLLEETAKLLKGIR